MARGKSVAAPQQPVDKRKRKWSFFWRDLDEGSGTMLGALLIAIAVLFMSSGALFGQVLCAQESARIAADVAAVASAAAASSASVGSAQSSACEIARVVANANGGRIKKCAHSGSDMAVSVSVGIVGVPGFPQASASATAGPEDCKEAP